MLREVLTGALKQLAGEPPLPQPGLGSTSGWRIGRGLPGERDYRQLVGDGMQNSIVAACILWLCRQFPKAPLMLEQRQPDGKLKRVYEHPLLDLWQTPNPFYDGVLMSWAVLASFLIDGNGYKLKRRSAAGRVIEEWYVPHWMLEPRWAQDGRTYIGWYDYTPGLGLYEVKPEDVVHYRYGLDPENIRKGRSPLKSLLREVYTDEEAARFTSSLLHNLGIPGVIITPTEVVNPDDADAVVAKFEQTFSGDGQGRVMALHGPGTVTPLGFDPGSLNLGALRELPEERVSAVLGVPAAVVGLGTGLEQTKVGATMAELRQIGWEDGIIPLHLLLAGTIAVQELAEFEADRSGWVVGFDTANVPELADALEPKAKAWVALAGGPVATRAEARDVFDLPVHPGDEVYQLPISIVETPAGAGAKSLGTKALVKDVADLHYLRSLDAIVVRHAAAMADDLESAFDRLAARAQTAFVEQSSGKALSPEDAQLVTRIIDAMRIEQWQADQLGPLYTRYTALVAEATFGAVSARAGVTIEWDIADPEAQTLLQGGGTRLGLLDLEAQTRQSLFTIISEARAEGLGPASIASRIRSLVPAGRFVERGARYRAELIARTETLHAQRASTLLAGTKAGFTHFVVFDARIGPTDEECELLNQQVVDAATASALMGTEHPNGTRAFAPAPRSGLRADAVPALKAAAQSYENPRCSSCNKKVAEHATAPFSWTCVRCGTFNALEAEPGEAITALVDAKVLEQVDGQVRVDMSPAELVKVATGLAEQAARAAAASVGKRVDGELSQLKDQVRAVRERPPRRLKIVRNAQNLMSTIEEVPDGE